MTCRRNPLHCPARQGNGTDITAADFILVIDDCAQGCARITDVWGYFRLPGDEHEDDALLTDGLEVPFGSPIAEIAHRVSADAELAGKVGEILRSNVTQCPCAAQEHCPALSDIRLLEAMERAIGADPMSQLATGGAE